MATQLLFIGTTELLLIGGLALLLFGGKKLPEMMKGLGQGVQSFKKGMKEPLEEEQEDNGEEEQEETTEAEIQGAGTGATETTSK
jgi:sec-independent protein translocase protein TatA